MTIEESIKQSKPFTCPYERAAVNLIYTANWIESEMRTFFGQYSLTIQQYNIMRILKGAPDGPISINYIRSRLLHKLSDVSRIIDRMEQKILIQKRKSNLDKRLIHIELTTSGQQLLEHIEPKMNFINGLLGHLSESEVLDLNKALDYTRTGKKIVN